MFTGIIEEMGTVRSAEVTRDDEGRPVFLRLCVQTSPQFLTFAKIGDSIAVEGVCLTVVETTKSTFTVEVMAETLRLTRLAVLEGDEPVNLERALVVGERLGGHIVQGHVDETATVTDCRAVEQGGNPGVVLRIAPSARFRRYLVNKGSVSVNGVSLTVSDLGDDWFEVSLIPLTLSVTTLATLTQGNLVHLEADPVGKQVAAYLQSLTTQGAQ